MSDTISRASWNAALDAAIFQLEQRADLWRDAKYPVTWGHKKPTPEEKALVLRVCEGECRAAIGHLRLLKIGSDSPEAPRTR